MCPRQSKLDIFVGHPVTIGASQIGNFVLPVITKLRMALNARISVQLLTRDLETGVQLCELVPKRYFLTFSLLIL